VPTDPAEVLRQHGIQVTAQRLAVLRAVSGQPHITADGVAEAVRAEIGAISLQSVYDALSLLVAQGLLRRIQPSGSPADDRGYEIDEAEVAYWGRCPDCLARSRTPSGSDAPTRRRRSQN
jgi:Fur family ferric uptake transcriptional regulator